MAYRNQDQRRHPRFSCKDTDTLPFSTLTVANSNITVLGQVQDISEGGVGIRSDSGIREDQVVRCNLSLSGVPVRVPTLMRARWSRKVGKGYVIGLQFLL